VRDRLLITAHYEFVRFWQFVANNINNVFYGHCRVIMRSFLSSTTHIEMTNTNSYWIRKISDKGFEAKVAWKITHVGHLGLSRVGFLVDQVEIK